jgi:hypothetical protein
MYLLTLTSTLASTDLALPHNTLTRALNSIYIQAPHTPLYEYNNFVAYYLATCQGLLALENVLLARPGDEMGGCDDSVKA